MGNTNRLELRWNGKDLWESPEPRILINKESFGAPSQANKNLLLHADNLLGLKALEHKYVNKIKCIYIDPPYNTKSLFPHYNDSMEHSLWLNMMKERLIILHRLLKEDGSIWISIDDRECHYLKILCDEIFGRKNFISCIVWNHSRQVKGYQTIFSLTHSYILAYKKSDEFLLNSLPRTEKDNIQYSNPDTDTKGAWCAGPVFNSLYRPNLIYDVKTPEGNVIKSPKKGWRWSKKTLQEKIKNKEVYFNNTETAICRKIYLNNQNGKSPPTIWLSEEVGTTREATQELKTLFPENPFSTPKPERLIHRILTLATNEGDLVLDCFAGSGSTGAVAHKMKRRWIMIECEDTVHSHIIPRLEKIISGECEIGITNIVNWKGGGGFQYSELAPSLMEKNRFNRWTISKEYNPVMLAEAICLHAGFTYDPKRFPYWMHGYSTENDFIYATSMEMNQGILSRISEEVGDERSLLIYCSAFDCTPNQFYNLTLKKIPKHLLKRCTWGKDDYKLKVVLQEEVKNANAKKNKTSSSSKSKITQRPTLSASNRKKR